jgi:hypothetical protein
MNKIAKPLSSWLCETGKKWLNFLMRAEIKMAAKSMHSKIIVDWIGLLMEIIIL